MIRTVLSFFLLIAVWASVPGSLGAEAGDRSFSEYEVKTAFLFAFVKFVEWPAEALPENMPVTLGILGKDPFGEALESLKGKRVKGRKLLVRRFKSVQELEPCHILFVCASEKGRFKEIFAALKDLNVLTVGETKRFAQVGGIINFILQEGKIRFEINVAAAEFIGAPTDHVFIAVGKGVCGSAVAEKCNKNIPDVSKTPNYLACSSATKSELVVLIRTGDTIFAQIDIDSHEYNAFDANTVKKVEKVADWLANAYTKYLKSGIVQDRFTNA